MNPWARVDCYIMEDPDMVRVGHRGFVLHVGGILYCQRNATDGYVPDGVVPTLAMDMPRVRHALKDLIAVGLWTVDEESNGYWIRNYGKWQRTKAQIEANRVSNALRQSDYRSRRNGVTDGGITTPETETETETETNLVTPENSSNLEKTVAAVGQQPPHFEPNLGHSQPKVPEWLRVLAELQQPTPEDVRRLTEWATPHDPGVLRETAYALVEKWPEYVAKPGNQNRKPFSTFQNWVRMEEKRNPPQSTGGADGEPGNGPDPYLRAQEQYERRRAQRP